MHNCSIISLSRISENEFSQKINSLKLDFDICGRNGMYDDNQLYAVYEKDDIEGLINVLKQCVPYE